MNKFCHFATLLVVAVLVSMGCSAKGGLTAEAPAADFRVRGESALSSTQREGTGYNAEATALQDDIVPQGGEVPAQRKLVKRASLSIRVENPEAADVSISALMEKHGAYAASTDISENSRHYVIRVPHTAYDAFLAGMSGMGRTLHRSESAEDVTLRYYDLEGRLATRQELLKTYQLYLGKAKNIEEILSVEARIADLQNEIDGTGKELRRLANQVDYASISLEIYGPVAAIPYSGPTLGERVKELFSSFGEFLSIVLVVVIGIVIYGIPILLLLVLLFWILFGRIGLIKKLWRLAAGKKSETK